ncbi:MAG: class I SAM-dependent methyltransferase [Paracoccaceae bacterium]
MTAAPPPGSRGSRRAERDALPGAILRPCHTAGAVLLPDRLALLDSLPAGGVAAEIGVADGAFSAEILARANPRRLHLIDIWSSGRYAAGEARVRETLAAEIASGRVSLDKGRSVDLINHLPPAYFDWVYIDTDHSYATTAAELRLCDEKVKPDGLILGHDYCIGNIVKPLVYGVIQAVNEFCVSHNWRYHALTVESHGHFSFALARIG